MADEDLREAVRQRDERIDDLLMSASFQEAEAKHRYETLETSTSNQIRKLQEDLRRANQQVNLLKRNNKRSLSPVPAKIQVSKPVPATPANGTTVISVQTSESNPRQDNSFLAKRLLQSLPEEDRNFSEFLVSLSSQLDPDASILWWVVQELLRDGPHYYWSVLVTLLDLSPRAGRLLSNRSMEPIASAVQGGEEAQRILQRILCNLESSAGNCQSSASPSAVQHEWIQLLFRKLESKAQNPADLGSLDANRVLRRLDRELSNEFLECLVIQWSDVGRGCLVAYKTPVFRLVERDENDTVVHNGVQLPDEPRFAWLTEALSVLIASWKAATERNESWLASKRVATLLAVVLDILEYVVIPNETLHGHALTTSCLRWLLALAETESPICHALLRAQLVTSDTTAELWHRGDSAIAVSVLLFHTIILRQSRDDHYLVQNDSSHNRNQVILLVQAVVRHIQHERKLWTDDDQDPPTLLEVLGEYRLAYESGAAYLLGSEVGVHPEIRRLLKIQLDELNEDLAEKYGSQDDDEVMEV